MVDKYSRFDGINGKHRNHYESSMMSSDLETTTFFESDDDASSRITATTGNISFSVQIESFVKRQIRQCYVTLHRKGLRCA